VARVTRITELGPAHVLVAETYNKRDDSQRQILSDQVLPNLLLIALTLGIVVLAIGAALKPLEQLRADIAERTARDLHPINVDAVPVDSRPVVESLNRLFESLRRAEQTQREFLANAAHQLRTPVTGLTTQIELAQIEGAFDATPERGERLQQALDQMRQLLDQLLTLSRAEAFGSSAHTLAWVDLKTLLEQQAGLFIDRAVARGIDLGYDLTPCRVQGIDWLLRELSSNLIDNALRYTPRGGEVTVSCGAGPQGAWLAVEDNGPGISEADRTRVFERFWRGEGSDGAGTETQGGSGLGMAIVREIAEQHRARVEINDALRRPAGSSGPGTRITVRFPAQA
jgi:two-component system sensor histidine kinase TctE